MAKKITIDDAHYNFEVNKSATYVIDSKFSQSNIVFNTNLELESPFTRNSYFYKSGNDLVLNVVTRNTDTNKITSTFQTIKDFYNTAYTGKVSTSNSYWVNKNTPEGESGENGTLYRSFKEKAFTTTGIDYVYGNNKSNTYTVNNSSYYNYIADLKGNETYNINDGYQINDYNGNDKYNFIKDAEFGFVYDINGNDKYTFEQNSSVSKINDYKGNDKYDLKKDSDIDIKDTKGNDKYIVESAYIDVEDLAGKDSYTIKGNDGSGLHINDKGGANDTYNIAYALPSKTTAITDDGGNDKFTLENVGAPSDELDDYTFRVSNAKGKDSYTIKGEDYLAITDDAGSDTYKFTDAKGVIEIDDKGGSNKFTVKESNFSSDSGIYGQLYINNTATSADKKHNDTYSFTNVKGDYYTGALKEWQVDTGSQRSVVIKDTNGSDKFSFNGTSYFEVKVSGDGKDTYTVKNSNEFKIYAGETNDKYTFTASNSNLVGGAGVVDNGGDDAYTFKKLDNTSVFISDKAGSKDKLVITGEKAANIIAISSGVGHNSGSGASLFLVDTQTGGWVGMYDFYSVTTGNTINNVKDGCIESVKIGSKTVKASENAFYTEFNELNQAVSDFLSQTTHDTIEQVFYANDATEIQALTQIFQGGNA